MQFSLMGNLERIKIFGMTQGELSHLAEILRINGLGRPDSNGFRCITSGEMTDFEGHFPKTGSASSSIKAWLEKNGANARTEDNE
jgi:hypothetical protein